jgi:hypothetical protein
MAIFNRGTVAIRNTEFWAGAGGVGLSLAMAVASINELPPFELPVGKLVCVGPDFWPIQDRERRVGIPLPMRTKKGHFENLPVGTGGSTGATS